MATHRFRSDAPIRALSISPSPSRSISTESDSFSSNDACERHWYSYNGREFSRGGDDKLTPRSRLLPSGTPSHDTASMRDESSYYWSSGLRRHSIDPETPIRDASNTASPNFNTPTRSVPLFFESTHQATNSVGRMSPPLFAARGVDVWAEPVAAVDPFLERVQRTAAKVAQRSPGHFNSESTLQNLRYADAYNMTTFALRPEGATVPSRTTNLTAAVLSPTPTTSSGVEVKREREITTIYVDNVSAVNSQRMAPLTREPNHTSTIALRIAKSLLTREKDVQTDAVRHHATATDTDALQSVVLNAASQCEHKIRCASTATDFGLIHSVSSTSTQEGVRPSPPHPAPCTPNNGYDATLSTVRPTQDEKTPSPNRAAPPLPQPSTPRSSIRLASPRARKVEVAAQLSDLKLTPLGEATPSREHHHVNPHSPRTCGTLSPVADSRRDRFVALLCVKFIVFSDYCRNASFRERIGFTLRDARVLYDEMCFVGSIEDFGSFHPLSRVGRLLHNSMNEVMRGACSDWSAWFAGVSRRQVTEVFHNLLQSQRAFGCVLEVGATGGIVQLPKRPPQAV